MSDPFDTKLTPAVVAHGQICRRKLHESGIVDPGFHQIFRKPDADARTRGICLNIGGQNPESIKTCCRVQRCCGVIAGLQRLRQPQRLHCVATPLDGFKRLPHLDKDRVLQGGVVGTQIGVDGGEIGLLVVGAAVVFVGLPGGIEEAGILSPIVGCIGQVQPCTQKPAGGGGVTHSLGVKSRLEMLLGAVGTGHMGICKGFGLLHDPRQLPALHKVQLDQTGLGAGRGLCFGVQYKTRQCAIKWRCRPGG